MCDGILEEVDDISMISDREGFSFVHSFLGEGESLFDIFSASADPTLIHTSLDTRLVDFGDDGGSAGDLGSLGLSATHAAKT